MPHLSNDQYDAYKAAVDALDDNLCIPPGVRSGALSALKETGFPTRRHEDWRYMDLSALSGATSIAGKGAEVSSLPAADIQLVFIGSHFSADHSKLDTLPEGMIVSSLAASGLEWDAADAGDDGIGLLNTALMQDGVLIQVPAGVTVEAPIEIVYVMQDSDNAASHIRSRIELADGSKATIVERFIGDESAYWANHATFINVSENASLTHMRLVTEGAEATNTTRINVAVEGEGHYGGFTLTTGGKAVRSETSVTLLGTGAHADVDGLSLAGNGQTQDTFVRLTHAVADTTSDQVHRAVLKAKGKTAFQGKVIVEKDAQRVEADQSCKSLMLERGGEANAKPELEIFADDVKCSHGATVGELDEKALFYMLARGVEPLTAQGLLVQAFAGEAITRIEDDTLLAEVTETIEAWLVREAANG